jgi:hypothetical protein
MISDTIMSTPVVPEPTPAAPATQPNPFRDDPQARAVMPARPLSVPSAVGRTIAPTRPPVQRTSARHRVQRTSFEAPTEESMVAPQTIDEAQVDDARPLVRASSGDHYVPRRATSLRQTNGTILQQAPIYNSANDPTLRFRESP